MKKLISSLLLSLYLFSPRAFAHGAAEELKPEPNQQMYLLTGFIVLFIVLFACYYVNKTRIQKLTNAKKQADRHRRAALTKWTNGYKWGWIVSLIGIIIFGGISLFGNTGKASSNMNLLHIHGLGYSNDGKTILVPSHDGLRTYSAGHWSIPEGDKHDYMGFSAVDDGFYSSGHPAPGSTFKNPMGIVKSTDGGKTLATLALEGESDFHGMSVSYHTHTIYVFNSGPNSKMSSAGLFYSKDDAKSWVKSGMQGLEGEPAAIAVHPVKDNVVAIGTSLGVYVSEDYGMNFEKIISDQQVTALHFNNEGLLYVGGFQKEPLLQQLDVNTKERHTLSIPKLTGDMIAYIAQNPAQPKEFVFATLNKDIYLSHDGGHAWTRIAEQGTTISEAHE